MSVDFCCQRDDRACGDCAFSGECALPQRELPKLRARVAELERENTALRRDCKEARALLAVALPDAARAALSPPSDGGTGPRDGADGRPTMSEPVKLWRYYLPTVDGLSGWAEIVLGSNGFFAAVSDYGNYSYAWRDTGRADFRAFVAALEREPDYIAGKLGPCSGHQFPIDYERTIKCIREHIVSSRRDGLSKERARREWEAVRSFATEPNDYGLNRWFDATGFDDRGEFVCRSPPAGLRAFCERTIPRLAAAIRAEMEAERASNAERAAGKEGAR